MLETLRPLLQPNDKFERCGLLLRDGTVVEIENIAKDRVNSYEMDPVEALPYLTGDQVAGTWHTHPHNEPQLSGEDYSGFLGWPELKHHVIGVENGEIAIKSYEVRNGAVFECD